MNAFYVVVLAATIVGAVYFIPRAVQYDRAMAELEHLDDQSLAAAMENYNERTAA